MYFIGTGVCGTLTKPTCVGTGLVTLDVIYSDQKKPRFLAGGSCGNVLTILSYLGWNSYPVSRLGKDPEGNRIIEDMEQWNVKTKFIEQEKMASPRIIEKIFPNRNPKHRFYITCEHGNWLPRRRPFLLKSIETIQHKLPNSNVFYFDRASPSALVLAKTLKDQGAIIYFEPPKFLHDDVFFKCLKISDIVKHCYEQSIETEDTDIKPPLEIRTKGEDGLEYKSRFLNHRSWKQIDAYHVSNLVDAAGSGDWLTAGLINVLCQHKTAHTPSEKKLDFGLRFGQALASLNCNYVGARGIMYNLSRTKLLGLVDKVMKKQSIKLPHKTKTISSKYASKCKVCLCNA